MSQEGTVAWLHDIYESFKEIEDGTKRKQIISKVKDFGLDRDADNLVEDWWEERKNFLLERGLREEDILTDDDGEFYFLQIEHGHPAEDDWGIEFRKIYLPEHLTVDNFV